MVDFISHFLIGIFVSNMSSLNLIQMIIFLIGAVLPDISLVPIYFYYNNGKLPTKSDIVNGGHNALESFFKNKKEKPKNLFLVYDFCHSIIFIIIISLLSLVHNLFMFLAFGLILHILVDIPTHKDKGPAIFFPSKLKIKGFLNWFAVYSKLKYKLIIWIILLLLIIISYFFK